MQKVLKILPRRSSAEIGSYMFPKRASHSLRFSATNSKFEEIKFGDMAFIALLPCFTKPKCLALTATTSLRSKLKKEETTKLFNRERFLPVLAEIPVKPLESI